MKFHNILLIILAFSFIIFFTGDTTIETGQSTNIESPSSNEEDWNQSTMSNPSFVIQSLYDLEKVPSLDKLLVNTTFIRQVYLYRIPYFLGYSNDGRYSAIISYEETNGTGYLIQIYDTLVGEKIYSAFVPNTERVVETEEFKLAKEALEHGFNINTPPVKLNWKNEMNYKANSSIWVFQQEHLRDRTNFMIEQVQAKTESIESEKIEEKNIKWLLLTEERKKKEENTYIELFAFPNKPEWVTMVHVHLNEEEGTLHDYTPTFIRLDHLSVQNSLLGRNEEADIWLYGKFQFIYSQDASGIRKGYLAVSSEDESESKQENILDYVEQWIYLDPSGKMAWYGNPQGVFSSEIDSSKTSENVYYYRINLLYAPNSQSLQYFIVDQIDQKTNELIQTLEFKWNKEKLQMIPI